MATQAIDIHTHLAGVGRADSGCFVSRRMRRTLGFHGLKRLVGLDTSDPGADDLYAQRLASLVRSSEHVDRAVALGLDGVYDDVGALDRERSHLYVPNEHVFRVCKKHPELLPGVSVNPTRVDAIPELERVAAAGAVLVKWLPPLQRFDPSDVRCDRFYQELARLKLPLLAHSGCEHTFPDMMQEFGEPERYLPALEQGVTLILAHCATACPIHRAHHRLDRLLEMMDRYPNLHADLSAMCSPLKFHHLLKVPFSRFPGRFLHGSDYPIPLVVLPYVMRLGIGKTWKLMRERNPIEADLLLKRALGVPDEAFTSAGVLLAERIRVWDGIRRAGG